MHFPNLAMLQSWLMSYPSLMHFRVDNYSLSLVAVVLMGTTSNLLVWSSVKNKMLSNGLNYSATMRALPYFGIFLTLFLGAWAFATYR